MEVKMEPIRRGICKSVFIIALFVLMFFSQMIQAENLAVRIADQGMFAHGSNPFMYPFSASNGKIYLGTYGPYPAKFYEIDPETGKSTTYDPGDYQLRMIAETSDGHIWTVSCYKNLLHEFSPQAHKFVGAYQWPGPDESPMICVAGSDDRIYTVLNRTLYSFDPRARKFTNEGLVMPEGPDYIGGGQRAQFGPNGNLYGVSHSTIFSFDPRTGNIKQIAARQDIARKAFEVNPLLPARQDAARKNVMPNIQYLYLMGNIQVGAMESPWIYGSVEVIDGTPDDLIKYKPIHLLYNVLFRCNIETGAVDCYPVGENDNGCFYDPVDKLHYFSTPEKGSLTLNGFNWEKRKVIRQIKLPEGDMSVFAGQAALPRHVLLTLPYIGILVDLDLATGKSRELFRNPQPVEVRGLAVARGGRAFGVTYDCGHIFERSTSDLEPGRSIGYSYLFRVCYGPLVVSRDEQWLVYPINCALSVRGSGVLPTAGAIKGRHVTDLVPIHTVAIGKDTFLVVHRGPWYTHQIEGKWDGRDEVVTNLSVIGKGVFRLHAASGKVEELADVPCAALAAMPDGTVIGCDLKNVWRLASQDTKPEILCAAPDQPVRLASSQKGDRIILASAKELFEVNVKSGKLVPLAGLPFAPERGLFCFANGEIVIVGDGQIGLLKPGAKNFAVWQGAIPGRVGPVAAPDENALYTVDRNLTRITWDDSAAPAPDER